MNKKSGFEYLDIDDLLMLAAGLFGDPVAIRDIGLLEAAVARPCASAFGEDAYVDLWSKAAAFLASIVNNHALVDGNKRLGWLSCATFLDLNGVDPTMSSNDAVYDLVVRVAAEQLSVEEIAAALRRVIEG